jgi:CheY-like chemotaxis protein
LAHVLKFEGFDVIVSFDGAEAIRSTIERPVDLILCDVLMKPLDGWHILDEVHTNPNTAQIPFVFMTGLERDLDREIDVSGYLVKPLSNEQLLAVVSQHLGR